MSEWQPINTAPKDTAVLILAGNEVAIAHKTGRGWYSPDTGGDGTFFRNPAVTHWMPIPELPPKSERSKPVDPFPHLRTQA